jgi:hypothetical protein
VAACLIRTHSNSYWKQLLRFRHTSWIVRWSEVGCVFDAGTAFQGVLYIQIKTGAK